MSGDDADQEALVELPIEIRSDQFDRIDGAARAAGTDHSDVIRRWLDLAIASLPDDEAADQTG